VLAADGRVLVSTDMLVEGRHFRLDWSTPHDVGRKAIAQNAADIAAMGARPTGYTVGLGCPGDMPVAVVDGLADGMWAEAARAGGSIVGGDIVRSPLLVISVTAFGDVGEWTPRSGARPGQTVAVAGRLGWSAAGLALLTAGLDDPSALLDAHRVPVPPYQLAIGAPASAMTDVSDGLLADLGHIAAASGVAVDLDAASLTDPALEPAARRLSADPLDWILTGGEDHAFVAAFDVVPPQWKPIGRIFSGSGITVDGVPRPGRGGWESFSG
jgi:thiamine-monophosphate kinase